MSDALHSIDCPYCGERFDTAVDASALVPHGHEEYIEDCPVCCRPIRFQLHADHAGELIEINTARDDD